MRVDRVSVKAATQVIVHPAIRHFPERKQRHIAGSFGLRSVPVPEEKIKDGRTRKLWRRTESAFVRIEALSQLLKAEVEPFSTGCGNVFAVGTHQIGMDCFSEPIALLDNLIRLFRPNLC